MRNVENRLRKLESKQSAFQGDDISLGWLTHLVRLEGTKHLAQGERVVEDWYRDRGGGAYAQERITSDPADHGRTCKSGGYLIDVLEERHRSCPERELRGSCAECEGTPVAECRPS
jgi:hypothetical protein